MKGYASDTTRMRTGKNGRFLLKYTILFTFLCFGVLFQFLLQNRSLVWKTDGAAQYIPYLHYMGNFLRDTLEGFFRGETTLKMYDFILGMGDDLGAVIRWHPLDLLSMIVPGIYTEYLYVFLILLRLYLAGLAFSVFCFYWGKEETAVLTGSMIYLFNGYMMIYGLRHPTFNAPLIILPLLLLGAEQVIRGQNGLFFSAITALGFVSNYYFMYMCSFAMTGYILLRFFSVYREKRVRNFFCMGIRLVLYYGLGIGLIAVILFPTVIRLMSSARVDGEATENMLFYENVKRYYTWFLNLIAPRKDTGYSTSLNYAVLVLPSLALLFVRKWKEHLTVKLALLLEMAGLLIPGFAFLMAGFSSVTNRWIFIFSFTLSYAVVTVSRDFAEMNRKQMAAICSLFVMYLVLCFWHPKEAAASGYWLCGAAELAACIAVLFLSRKARLSTKRWSRVLLAIVCVSCVLNGYCTFSAKIGNVASEYLKNSEALNYYKKSHYSVYKKIQDDSFYRVDGSTMSAGKENGSILLGYRGISMYNSIINAEVAEYLLDQESPGIDAIHRIFSMDGRAVSEALANVKYFLCEKGEEASVPFGYLLREDLSNEKYQIYENQYPLAVGYTYDAFISKEDYEKLDSLEKQQVMLEAAVLEQEQETLLKQISAGTDEIQTVPLELPREGENITATDYGYKVGKDGGSIRVSYEKREGYEAYLHFKGFYKNVSYSHVIVSASDFQKKLTLRGSGKTYSLDRRDYLLNLGYCDSDGEKELEIFFTDDDRYELEGMEICYVPLENYVGQIEKRNQESLENVVMGTNTISGDITVSEQKALVFSVPYSTGWKAYVDGEEADLQKMNVMYLGVLLEPGEHQVVLKYCTPGFWTGLWVTLVSVLIYLMLLIKWRAQRLRSLNYCAVQHRDNLIK